MQIFLSKAGWSELAAYIHTYTYIYIYKCTYIYIYIYIYIYFPGALCKQSICQKKEKDNFTLQTQP